MARSEEYVDEEMTGLSGILLRLSLDMAYTSEKSATLAAFSSRLFSKFGDTSTEETADDLSAETELEPALLSVITENLIQELELLMDGHREELVRVDEMAAGSGSLKDHLAVCRWRLRDSESYLKLSRERVSELKARSERAWGPPTDSADMFVGGVRGYRNGDCPPGSSGYGKDEYDICLEAAWGRFLEAENAAEVLLGVSKELQLHLRMPECDSFFRRRAEGGRVKDFHGIGLDIDDSAADPKVGILEGRVEEAEAKVEAMKAWCEAGREKQSMLNSAIWDMEILIGDLKGAASLSEEKIEAAEERCRSLAETNSALTREVLLLRGRVESLQKDLRAAVDEKAAWGDEVKRRTKAIMRLVAEIGAERGRLHKELVRLMRGGG